eukprot:TRINITY_DN12204_c0_g1_i1.p1 TRINITY_DN12204_c0_g1~~TRINITY_DN12204_c0_g1_i1.p1  ORF type:complete len:295 (-),score=1.22 TRINITY_DN12204_c0_g1_i1:162-1046(-)
MRAYRTYTTKSVFHCNGRLMSGPQRGQFYATLVLFLLPTALFFTFVAPYLCIHVSFVALVILAIIFTVLAFINLMVSAYRDPGVIPKNPTDSQTKHRNQKHVMINGTKVQKRYCVTCRIYRPPRAIHCSTCDNCVERFDHHCAWIGNCVGSRNYHTFFMFVAFVVSALIVVEVSCILHITFVLVDYVDKYGAGEGLGKALSVPPPDNIIISFILAVYAVIGICPIGFLLCFHILLVSRNITTNEYLKNLYDKGKTSPYSHGCFMNFITILCPRCWPRYLEPREIVEPTVQNIVI